MGVFACELKLSFGRRSANSTGTGESCRALPRIHKQNCVDFVLQLHWSRRDAEDAVAQLEQCQRELMSARQNTDMEISKAFVNSLILFVYCC